MTKKVLISLDDYIQLQEEAMKYEEPTLRLMKFRELFLEWFDAQPSSSSILKDTVLKFMQEAVSKMEATGDKDDN